MKALSFNTHLHMLFQHDGISSHYSCEVCQWQSGNYPGSLTGNERNASVSWPARSADMHLFDFFFLWGYLEIKVFKGKVSTREELWDRIKQFASEVKSTPGTLECL